MSEFSIQVSQEKHSRAVDAAKMLLAYHQSRYGDGLYVQKLGHLTVAFEAYHISRFEEAFIGLSECSYNPEVVRVALTEIIENYPSRRAYPQGRRSYKVSGRTVDSDISAEYEDLIDQLFEDVGSLNGDELRRKLRESRPFPWE